jgi:hypothetical protein
MKHVGLNPAMAGLCTPVGSGLIRALRSPLAMPMRVLPFISPNGSEVVV